MRIYSRLGVQPRSTISVLNSSSTPLSGGATFTGTAEFNDYPDVRVNVFADVSGTLIVDFSTNGGTNYDSTVSFDVAASTNEFHTLIKGARTCRVRYVNDSGAQSTFRLQTEFGTFRQANAPLNSTIQQDSDAATVRAITEETSISGGLVQGYSIVNKFGTNSDIDTGSVPEDIWEGGGTYTGFPDSALEAVEVVSDSASDAGAGTGARSIRVTGLDGNYDVLSETITLNGTTPADSVGTFRRVHTAQIITAGSGGVNAGTITIRHTTTTANVFATMLPGRNQTNCSCYTVPAGHTAYMRKIHAAIRGGTTGAVDGYLWTRSFGGVFRSRRPFTVGTSSPLKDEIYGGIVFTEKSDITMRITSASANNIPISGGYDLILVRN